MRFAATAVLAACLSGCSTWNTERVVPTPDAPLLILEVQGQRARVAGWVNAFGELVEIGWIDLKTREGWTLVNYDWDSDGD